MNMPERSIDQILHKLTSIENIKNNYKNKNKNIEKKISELQKKFNTFSKQERYNAILKNMPENTVENKYAKSLVLLLLNPKETKNYNTLNTIINEKIQKLQNEMLNMVNKQGHEM